MFSKTISLVMSVCMLITSAPLGGVLEEIGNLIDNFGQKIADSADNLGQNGEDTSATTEEKDFVVSENAVDTWDGKTSTPTLSGSIYAINTAEELAWVASQYSNKFKGYTIQLNNDIDLAGHNWERIGGHSSVGSTSATYYFDGTFDGQGHTISNMTITETNYGRTGYVGLFGYIGENAVVKNVGLINPVITVDGATGSGNNYGVGALIGYCKGKSTAVTKVEKCFVRGGSISVVDTGSNMGIGGLIGNLYYRADIKSCYVQGTTIISEPKNNTTTVGGLIGYVYNATGYRPTLTSCYAVANYDCYTSNYVGGLVGSTPGKTNAQYCYAANDTTKYPKKLVGNGSFNTSTGCTEVTSAVLKTYADTTNTRLNALGEVYYPDNGKKNSGFPVFENEYIADTEVQEKIKEAEAAMDKSNYVYYAAIVKHSPDLFPNLQTAIDNAYAYLEDSSLIDKQVCLASLQTAIDAVKNAENTYSQNPDAYKPTISINAPKTAYVFDGNFGAGDTVTVVSNYLLDPHSVTANKGLELTFEDMTTETVDSEVMYNYNYIITGGVSAETAGRFNITYFAEGKANGQTATATMDAVCLALKRPGGSESVEFNWNLEYSAKSLGTKVGTAELYFKLVVTGIHGVLSDIKSVTYEKDDSSSKYYGREYDKYSYATPNAVFYSDRNTNNTLAKVSGISDTDAIKFNFYDTVDIDDNEEDAQTIETVDVTVNRIADPAGDDYNNDTSDLALGELNADLSGTVDVVTVGANLYSPNPQHGDKVDIKYSMVGYAEEVAEVFVGGSMDFNITYQWVDTKDLWKLYKTETDEIKRFDYEHLYSSADEEAWKAYEEAYINAAQVLCGGVTQETINAAKVQLADAIRNLKTLVQYDLNGGESDPELAATPVNIYSNVSVSEGVVSYTNSIIYSTELSNYSTVTREGYAPCGWSLTPDNNKDSVFDNITLPETAVKEPLTVYMVWELGAYTVIYDSNAPADTNPIGSMPNQVCQCDESYAFNACGYIIDNYTFVGWNTLPSGNGTMYEPKHSFVNLASAGTSITLYAVWKESATAVVFNINLPTGVTQTTSGFDKTTVEEFKVGSVVDLTKTPYKLESEGYDHIGWSTQAGASTPTYIDSLTVPGNTITLYAVWVKKTASVIYVLNGGELIGDGYTKANTEITFGEKITLPSNENAYKAGHTLFGWKSDYDGEIYNDECIMPDRSGTITFTAEWAPKTITITLHHNNDQNEDVVTTISGMYDTAIDESAFAAPQPMDGYTFVGWFVKNADTYSEYETPLTFPGDNVELYAGWSMDYLASQITRFPFDIDETGTYKDGTVVPYYKEEGKVIAKNAYAEANDIYNKNDGILYLYSDIKQSNDAASALEVAINALVPNPADYSVVNDYITYYYEMLPENERPPETEYADTHSYTYEGEVYQVTYEYFTKETFDAFANAVNAVVKNKPLSAQKDVDKYAEDLKAAYDNLQAVKADYSEYNKYIEDALILNGDLEEFHTEDTLGILWYEESSWYAFFEMVQIAESELLKEQNIFYQSVVDEYALILEEVYNSMMLNGPDFSVYDENGYAYKALDVYNDTKSYTEAYRTSVYQAYLTIESAKTNGELSRRYDQEKVDKWINDLVELLEKPSYRRYILTFYMNDKANNVFRSEDVSCVAEIRNYSPGIPERDGYSFIGWYTTPEDTVDDIGQKIDIETTTELMGTEDRNFYARWEKNASAYRLEVSAINASLKVSLDDSAETSEGDLYINENVYYGTEVLLTAVAEDNSCEFMYWKDNRGRIVSYDITFAFVLEADRTLIAVYSEKADSGYYSVVFVDSVLNTVISEQKVAANSGAIAPEMPETYNEYEFIGWDKSFDCITDNLILKSVYANPEEVFSITVDINGEKTVDTYRYNTPVKITLSDELIPEGMIFAGWSLDNGATVFTCDREYRFYAYKDMTVTAVFAERETVEGAIVIIDTAIKEENNGKFKAEIMITRNLPEDYVFVSSGVLLTKNSAYANKNALTFESQSAHTGEIDLLRTVRNTNNGQYKVTVNTSADSTVYARGFVVYLNKTTGEVVTVYTDVTAVSVK